MTRFTHADDLRGAEFAGADLRGARFVGADLSGARLRGVQVEGVEIDAPWLSEGDTFLRVNDVDVIPLVEAELNRRFPGRELRSATSPAGLRDAWAAVEAAWEATLARATAMAPGTVTRFVTWPRPRTQALRTRVGAWPTT